MRFQTDAWWLLTGVFVVFPLLMAQDPPEILIASYITRSEGTRTGTALMNITASDPGGGNITLVTNSKITESTVSLAKITATVWSVVLISPLDYEIQQRITLSFLAQGQLELPVTTVLFVSDVNDNPPHFQNLPYHAEAPENATPNMTVFQNTKTYDPDTGAGGSVRYSLQFVSPNTPGWSNVFVIDLITGYVNLTGKLDYETTTIYHYRIVATDQASNHLSSSTDLFISVMDVQDTPPHFTNPPYIASVLESSALGSSVLTVKALDGDSAVSNDVVYSIIHSDCQAMFGVNNVTGEIFVASGLDRDVSPLTDNNGLCTVTVQATELNEHPPQQGAFTADQRVTITVQDVNDNRPIFSRTRFSANISENSEIGTQLLLDHADQIYVEDKDQGANSVIRLTLNDSNNTFELVSTSIQSSGTITIRVKNKTNLDFESRKQIDFTITAEDSGGAGNINSTAYVTVQILNLNEFSPIFTQSNYSRNVQEGSPRDASVIQITTQDSDDGIYGNIKYSLENARSMFKINSNDGTVTLLSSQTDRETVDTYYMLVLATDGGGLIQTAPLIVTITDANDNAPQFSRNQYDALLDEDSLTFSRPLTLQATDLDQLGTPNSNVSFAIVGSVPANYSSNFRLDPMTGNLTVITKLDYDILPFAVGKEGKVILTVTASDQGNPRQTSTAVVEIVLNDVNDNTPVFQNTPYHGSIDEGDHTGLSIVTVRATDADKSAPNNALLYSIESGGQDRFRINSTTGTITTSATLDRESLSIYTLVIVVRDQAPGPKSTSTNVQITVNDVNDEKPSFLNKSVNIEKNEGFYGILYPMSATDPDSNPHLNYSIVSVSSSGQTRSLQSWITIDSSTGNLRTLKPLNRTAVSKFDVQVQVEDLNGRLNGPQNDPGVITITVLDINDHDPVFSPTSNVKANIRENLGPGTPVTFAPALRVSDDDEGINSLFSLTLNDSRYFEITPGTVQSSADVILRVKSGADLDYEMLRHIDLLITANETGTTEHRSATVIVRVDIEDENDNSPIFQQISYNETIPENSTTGHHIVRVHATDADGSPKFNTITYSLQGAGERFRIDNTSGEVTLGAAPNLDFDTSPNVYQLTVEATDSGGRRDSTQLIVHLSDVNDLLPVFTPSNRYHGTLKENSPSFDIPLEVLATDGDQPRTPNSNITYSITSGTNVWGQFQIPNQYSGIITISAPLDFEALQSPTIQLNITAKDGGSPQQMSIATVVITVEDINDHTPGFSGAPFSVNISENANRGASVFKFNATDGDGSVPNNDVFYLIKSGANDQFTIDSITGLLSTSANLNRDETAAYSVVVLAIDKGVPPRTGTATLTINIADINNVAPSFPIPEISVTKMEGDSGDIHTFNATDPDLNHDLRYMIIWNKTVGYDAEMKLISDANMTTHLDLIPSGILRTNGALDREQMEWAVFVVMVEDLNAAWGRQTATATLSLSVRDRDDNPPLFTADASIHARVEENAKSGFPIEIMEQVYVTDKDKDANSDFNLSLSGNYGQWFDVVPKGAVRGSTVVGLRVKNNAVLDYEAATSLSFKIIAHGIVNTSFSSECNVTLNITNMNDFTPEFSSREYSASIPENATIATPVVTVKATDGDSGLYGSLTYSIVGGSSMFSINVNGDITTVQAAFNRETTSAYFLTVMATDGGGTTNTTTVHVNITDVNDEPPVFQRMDYYAVLKENALNFDLGVTVVATDNDQPGTDNVRITYGLRPHAWSTSFTVDPQNGTLYVTKSVNYEATGSSVTLVITATDHGSPPMTGFVNVTVTVQDMNDEKPNFTSLSYYGNISESSPTGTNVTTVNANDADGSAPNNDIFYIIASGGNDQFTINSRSGVISTVSVLDREKTPHYNIMVLAVDKGSPANTASVNVSVDVINVNDDLPTFTPHDVTVTVKEGLTPGFTVYTFSASDGDSDASLQYTLFWNLSFGLNESNANVSKQTLRDAFSLNTTTGLISVNQKLDRETLATAILVIVVKDVNAFSGNQTATGTLTVTIQDIDDNPPVFYPLRVVATVEENWGNGMPVSLPEITVTDVDKDQDSEFVLSLSNLGETFEVVPSRARGSTVVGLRVKNNTLLDFEKRTFLSFQIIAEGMVNKMLRGTCDVLLNITNMNDFMPIFERQDYPTNILENSTRGATVTQVKATDGDAGILGDLRYSIIGSNSPFSIDNKTGVITTASTFDRETTPEYFLTVMATDGGGATSTVRSNVIILDSNDQTPKFLQTEYMALLKENAGHFESKIILEATDNDQVNTSNSEVRYGLLSSTWSPYFDIGAVNGSLSVKSSIDFERCPGGQIQLTATATDQGIPRLTGSVSITITIQDENDMSPNFPRSSYIRSVTERGSAGLSVATVYANDSDGSAPNNDVFYIINSGGSDQFVINSTTGEITTRVMLDRETTAFYSLEVLAVDKGSPARTATAYVNVTVLNVNDDNPRFLSSVVSVTPEEEQPSGTVVCNFTAVDGDSDAALNYTVFWNVSYGYDENQIPVSLVSLHAAFRIDQSTGLIMVNKYLDREVLETATLVVVVEDMHANTTGQTATGTVSIQVKDKDDHPPAFSTDSVSANISENSPVGTPLLFVIPVIVTDQDKDTNSMFNLTLSNFTHCLEVVPSRARSQATVLVRVANATCFDYEKQQSIHFLIISSGEGASRFERNTSVQLIVNNENDETPRFDNQSYSAHIAENATKFDSIITVHANDLDRPNWNTLTYTLQGGDGMFTIDKNNGNVTVAANASLDFERRSEYQVTVEATDPGRRRDSAPLTITLTDVNDNAPVFLRPEYQAYVTEGKKIFDISVTVQADDADTGVNKQVEYYKMAESQLADNFTVNRTTGQLGLSSELDYERLPDKTTGVVTLLVGVRDHGVPPRSSNVTVTVTVKDTNDNPPVFYFPSYRFSISEAAGQGDPVGNVSARDDDGSAPNNNIFYVIADGGNDKFQIDSSTGHISRAGQLDSDTVKAYNVTVHAIDAGTPSRTGVTYVLINVTDVNDVSPVFNPTSRIESVNETNGMKGTDSGRVLTTLWATDTDEDKQLKYVVVWQESKGYGPNQELLGLSDLQTAFQLEQNSGRIKVNTHVDREVLSRAVLVVNVTDQHAAPNTVQTATGTLTINVLDVNDHKPELNSQTFTAVIAENSPVGSLVTFVTPDRMTVTDNDTDQNCLFSVRVEGDMGHYFVADPATARSFALVQLRVINGSLLDYEERHNITLTVIAQETATADKFSQNSTVVINIKDVNDNDPQFFVHTVEASVPENSPAGTTVATIKANDSDSESYGRVTFSLEGDKERFRIDNQTGRLTTADSRTNRETKDLYLMTVVATDGGGRRTGVPLTISILDENDNAPYFVSNYTTRIKENSLNFNPPIAVQANDIDEANTNNSDVTYHIAQCPLGSCSNFTIDKSTGALHLSSPLDYENVQIVQLIIEAKDKGRPELTGSATISVTVEDENDETPKFTNGTFYASVRENSKEGTYLGTLHANDNDASSPNKDVFFVLSSGGSDNFRVNSTTGAITVGPGASLDRERDFTFTLVVLALDRGDPPKSSTATVSVTLLDENDESPKFNLTRVEVTISENSTETTSVWTMAAKDEDSDPDLVYSLLLNISKAATDRDASVSMDSVWDWFTINATDGTVSVNSGLDRETAEKVILRIMVNDTNGATVQTAEATLIITLQDVNDNEPIISGNNKLRVSEALAIDTEVASLSASDRDRDQSVTFNMSDAVSNFTITPDGKIILKHALDRETQPSVSFTVVATDNGSPPLSSNLTITVNVTDANDNDPVFTNNNYTFSISENAGILTVVATMTATDRDEGANAIVTFDFADNVNDFEINKTTGEILVKRQLDRETTNSYKIGVVALDNPQTEEKRRAAKQITIIVTDYNDNAPTFNNIDRTLQGYVGIITESAGIGDRLTNLDPGVILCSDRDEGQNARLSFLLESLDGVDFFRMNSDTGVVFVNSMTSYTGVVFVNSSLLGHGFETYNYTVTVMDHGVPSLNSSVNLTIKVLDENNHRPLFVSNFSDPISIPECMPVKSPVAIFEADDEDRDKGTNGRVGYSVSDGSSGSGDAAFFDMSPWSGELSLAKRLNREDQAQFSLQITATDHGETQLSSVLNVIIMINDTNDNDPVFNKTNYYFSVAENDVNIVVGTVVAEDADEYKKTCYTLTGDLNDHFKIEADDDQKGIITIIKPLDRETSGQDSFSLTVNAHDCTLFANLCGENVQHKFTSATIYFTVTDKNDNPPNFTSPQLTRGFIATADYRHLIFDLQEYVTDKDQAHNSVHGFYAASPLVPDAGLEANAAVKKLENPLELTTNGTVRTNAKFPADAQGFFTWKILANDTGGSGNVTLTIYVVGEEKLIRVTFFHSEEELRERQDQVIRDLQKMTGLEFVADDLQEVVGANGEPDPTRSALMMHAMDRNGEFKDANQLQDYLDHQVEVTKHLKAQYQLLNIETAKAAKATAQDTIKTELILAAIIVVLVIAFLITLFIMVMNMKKFKRKLKAQETPAHVKTPAPEEIVPGIKPVHSNPIYGKDEFNMESNCDDLSVASDGSLDDNQVDVPVKKGPRLDEQEMTLQLYGEDNEAFTGSKSTILDSVIAAHDQSKTEMSNGYPSNGVAKIHNGVRQSVMLDSLHENLDELQSTEI